MKKYIQPQVFQTHQSKDEAILLVQKHVNEHLDEFRDGEELTIEHRDINGAQMYSTAIIRIKNGVATVYASIETNETLRIIESDEEPDDKKVIWIAEDDSSEEESGTTEDLKAEIESLKRIIREMKDTVERHDYALSSTIAGGDIILNSEKYQMENETESEKPDDAVDNTEYATDDLVIDSFEVFIANSPLTRFATSGSSLYINQKYFLKLKLYNTGKEEIKNDGSVVLGIQHGSDVSYEAGKQILIGLQSGFTTIYASISDGAGLEMTKTYPLSFEYNEKPGYETYAEPNVKHVILKSVKNLQILKDNFNYLCVNEPIWCISEHALYVKGEMSNGGVALFKISGGSGGDDPIIPDTGDTSGDTTSVTINTPFVVDENGTLIATSDDENSIYVDENGILIINVGGEVTDDGILILQDTSEGGGGGGDGGDDTPSGESDAIVDEDGELIITGDETTVDSNGILLLNATVTLDGILTITA